MTGKSEFIGHFINLPQDGEGTYVVGAQLLAGESQVDILGGKPNSVPQMVKRCISMTDMCLNFLATDCLLLIPIPSHPL